MADFTLYGFIEGIRYSEQSAAVTVSERKMGYRKKDGTYVDEDIVTFRVIFKEYFKKYLSTNFSEGMLVKVKGTLLPYVKDRDGNTNEGFTLLGQTIDREAYPKSTTRLEHRMIKESALHGEGTPDVEGFRQDDFKL